MRESRESLKGMDTYKAQLHRIWPKEDVQQWVTSFNECMQQAQSARDAALDLARNKGQVFTLLLHAAMTTARLCRGSGHLCRAALYTAVPPSPRSRNCSMMHREN